MVAAALLVDDHRVLRNIKVAITETFFHIDKNIGEIAVLRDHVLGGVVALASGILAHVDFGRLGRGAVKLNSAANRSRGGGIDWSGGCRWFRLRSRGGRLLFARLLATARQERQPDEGKQAQHSYPCP